MNGLLRAVGRVNPIALIGGVASLTITAAALYFGIKMELALVHRDIADIKRSLSAIEWNMRRRSSPYGSSRSFTPPHGSEDV